MSYLRFTSGATPLLVYYASIAASHLPPHACFSRGGMLGFEPLTSCSAVWRVNHSANININIKNLIMTIRVWVSQSLISIITTHTAFTDWHNTVQKYLPPSHNFGTNKSKQPLKVTLRATNNYHVIAVSFLHSESDFFFDLLCCSKGPFTRCDFS